MSDSASIQAGETDAPSTSSTAPADSASSSDTAQAPVATALQDLIAGGAAGSASVVVGHPFDTYKVRLQTSKPGCTESTKAFGGVSSLFRGMAAPLCCASVVNAIIFSSFGESSRLWDEKVEHRAASAVDAIKNESGDTASAALPHDSFTKSFCCGSFAGFAQSFVICPMEHIKCRLQVQHGAGSADAMYRGPFDALYKIISNHGVGGLFRGMCVTWWREIPAFGLYFSTYDYIKDTGNQLFADENGDVKDWHAWGASAFAGGTSGCFTWLIICEYFTSFAFYDSILILSCFDKRGPCIINFILFIYYTSRTLLTRPRPIRYNKNTHSDGSLGNSTDGPQNCKHYQSTDSREWMAIYVPWTWSDVGASISSERDGLSSV